MRLILWFTLISAVVGAFYAHILAVMDGSPLFTLDARRHDRRSDCKRSDLF